MELTEPLQFDHTDRKDIYEYVESHGSVDPEEARKALRMEPHPFGHHVAIMKRDGVLTEYEEELRIAYEDSGEEEFQADDVEFTIRQARQEDLTGLVGAIRAAIGSGEYIDAETVADVIDTEGVLLRHNELESRIFFVACIDNDVIGWVHLKHTETKKLSHTAELTVGVLAQYRGHGIGAHLLERGTEWASDHGYEKLYNSVPSTNQDAIDFLEAHDWETEAVREDHYKFGDEYADEVMLARSL
ncbi:GNAT family N-acetyltransferase [Haloarcula nitratireducens]|uniref:GNAT family N-acetyltransferase n=1 Tax=Haloarcula nitratireducens TaxID=2487749 RepID=A0AAW4P955_9EURY|nr:GNAT family N-acetyltransferase [Halomicroarcula nitratireducens]MBX0294467.1 GNAT family N-acetyltransferase [Halomicroarcula nitratireducens]